MKIAVAGGGSWGSALAHVLAANNCEVALLVRDAEQAQRINTEHTNPDYLPDVVLHSGVRATLDDADALHGAAILLMAVPCQHFRGVLQRLKPLLPPSPVVVCANKGIEVENLCTVSQVVEQVLEGTGHQFAMLSGPSFAAEVMRDMPTAVVMGCENPELGRKLQHVFSYNLFRTYSSTDVRGVELGGAVKNVIAIAAGLADGLDFGHNARAALITRGLAEMSRLGVALGARASTFMGLSGMGDLVLTCTGDLSRNRQVGLKLAEGLSLDEIVRSMRMVAEGVKTTEAVYTLAQRLGVDLPITSAMYDVLHNGKNPTDAVRELMSRDLKEE
ncbi:NAD(P)H-dependent glycerol-3-phosphate dehydrogenase [Oleidesulfovibrio sp.]|uniref:NAD(P)H-dependent glycerol-3-phosphate dehydrogenase n=1 Tax=Oleidesulfovibrio sp. TaxID=2909707 RepID=UPI003A89040D